MSKDGVAMEDDYFHREDQERIRKLKEKMEAEKAAAEKAALKDLHFGHCGKCGTKMNAKVFKGVEIDVCPGCGAVLLDPGELETLVGQDKGGIADTIVEMFSFARKKG